MGTGPSSPLAGSLGQRVLGALRVPQPGRPWRGAHRPDHLPILQVVAEEEEDASGPWEPERTGKGSPGSGPEADSSSRRGTTEPGSNPVCGEQEEEDDDEEEEEGSCCSEEGEDGSNVYFYYTIGERWIDYLQRTEDGGLLRHARPKVTPRGRGAAGGVTARPQPWEVSAGCGCCGHPVQGGRWCPGYWRDRPQSSSLGWVSPMLSSGGHPSLSGGHLALRHCQGLGGVSSSRVRLGVQEAPAPRVPPLWQQR